jgi:hypothetical protein
LKIRMFHLDYLAIKTMFPVRLDTVFHQTAMILTNKLLRPIAFCVYLILFYDIQVQGIRYVRDGIVCDTDFRSASRPAR